MDSGRHCGTRGRLERARQSKNTRFQSWCYVLSGNLEILESHLRNRLGFFLFSKTTSNVSSVFLQLLMCS
jgi:hypothetical protein